MSPSSPSENQNFEEFMGAETNDTQTQSGCCRKISGRIIREVRHCSSIKQNEEVALNGEHHLRFCVEIVVKVSILNNIPNSISLVSRYFRDKQTGLRPRNIFINKVF